MPASRGQGWRRKAEPASRGRALAAQGVTAASCQRHAAVTWPRLAAQGGTSVTAASCERHTGVMRASRGRGLAAQGVTPASCERHAGVMWPKLAAQGGTSVTAASCRRHASVTWPRLAAERGARLVRGGRSLRRRGLEQCRECRQSAARMASWAKSSRDSEARPYSAMKASTMCRASSSRCWTGGLFMKYALGPSSAPARP